MNTERIISLISEQFNVDESSINLETSFRDDLNADSLDLVELIMALLKLLVIQLIILKMP